MYHALWPRPGGPPHPAITRSVSRARVINGIAEIVRRAVEAGLPAGVMRALSRPPPPVSAAVADDRDLLGAKSQIAHRFSDQFLAPACGNRSRHQVRAGRSRLP
jgi:hypothetical protein